MLEGKSYFLIPLAVVILLASSAAAIAQFWANQNSYTVGSGTTTQYSKLVALTNTQTDVADISYDTFESPRGTPYQVPLGETMIIISFRGSPHAAAQDVHYQIGYGDDAVSNALGPPTNPVILWEVTWRSLDTGLMPELGAVWIPIPERKFPYVFMSDEGNVQVTGLLEDE